jgi:membrane-bound lytic murein transglycosylase MltF
MTPTRIARLLLACTLFLSACSDTPERVADSAAPGSTAAAAADEPLPPLASEAAIPAALRALIDRPFTGDLDGMEERRIIRVGVTFNRTHYFVDGTTERGLSFEHLRQFETNFNTARRTRNLRVHVVFVPLARDQLLPALTSGRVDLVAAQLTITPERQALSEVVVTAPGVPAVKSAEDLSGQRVFVRPSSSYADSLRTLSARLEGQGRAPITILDAPEYLEDDDLLEMVNAALVDITVVDDYLAQFWAQLFTDMTVNHTATLRTGGDLAIAFRKNSPKLAAEANAFIATHGLGTVFGNVINRRFLQDTQVVERATRGGDRERFLAQRELFRKFGDQYRLDYLLMMAKGYQESRLNQAARSPVGAIGVMQIMPALARSLDVGDVRELEPNIHAGVKYTRRLMDDYLGNEPLDELNRALMTFASYNAGPTRIRQLRREAERRNLDPNVWFDQVERIAAERIGRETVMHVRNISKYYVAFLLFEEDQQRRSVHRATGGRQSP